MKNFHQHVISWSKKIANHVQKHHKKYLWWFFAGFAVFKTLKVMAVMAGFLVWLVNVNSTSAQEAPQQTPTENDCVFGGLSWDNENFLDENFWTQWDNLTDPEDKSGAIICALYGSGEWDTTAYTNGWNNYTVWLSCEWMNMNVEETDELQSILTWNTIYVLNTNALIAETPIRITDNCTAIVSKNWTIFYIGWDSSYSQNIFLKWEQYWILDNIAVNWTDNWIWWTHEKNDYWIRLSWSNNNSFHNIQSYNSKDWIWLFWSNYNKLNNIQSYNNENWISLIRSNNNKLNDIESYNNRNWIYTYNLWSNNVFNNIQSYNNNDAGFSINENSNNNKFNNIQTYNNAVWFSITNASNNNSFNNIQSYNNTNWFYVSHLSTKEIFNNIEIYNNSSYWFYIYHNANSRYTTDFILNNIFIYNNWWAAVYAYSTMANITNSATFYWKLQIFNNSGSSSYENGRTRWGYEYENIWFMEWSKSTNWILSFDLMTNPVDETNNYLLDWGVTSPIGLRWKKLIWKVMKYSYWSWIRTQAQPVIWNGNTLTTRWNYDSSNYIWSDIKKVEWNLEMWYVSITGYTIVTWTSEELISNYTIFGDIINNIIGQQKGLATWINFSTGGWLKKLIIQLYWDGLFATHFEREWYVPENVVVIFDGNRWTVTEPKVVISWETVTQPENNPVLPWYEFNGWYTDSTLTVPFDFNTPITSNITLYAKRNYTWEIVDLNLYFIGSTWVITSWVIMDRNLWASEPYNWDYDNPNSDSYGYYYQWWNNYGFQNIWSIPTTSNTVPYSVWTQYTLSKYASWIFVTWPDSTWMESGSLNDNIWWWYNGTYTGRQWPCPDDYHLPIILDWTKLYNNWSDAVVTDSNPGKQRASNFLMPFAGYRDSESNVFDRGTIAHYWTAKARDEKMAYTIFFDAIQEIAYQNGNWRNYGLSLRCFKNNQNPGLIINPKWWTWAMIAFTGVVNNWIFTKLDIPSRANSEFSGWYNENDVEVNIWSSVSSEIHAEWKCNEHHHEVWNSCVIDTYTVTIQVEPNGYGTVTSESVEWGYWTSILTQSSQLRIWSTVVTATPIPTTDTDDWYFEFSGWDLSNCRDTLTQNCTIIAQFRKKFTVTFDANRWTIVGSQNIVSWDVATEPSTTLPWYYFSGWYLSWENTLFGFNTPITWDITLCAKWRYNLEFDDLNIYFLESNGTIKSWVIMDRNMWATEIFNKNYDSPNDTSYGYYYQRWNNYWFATTWTISTSSRLVPKLVWSGYVPSKYANGQFILHPHSWIEVIDNDFNDNLWWWKTNTVEAMQWPCPGWYHVPNKTEWSNLYNNWNNARTPSSTYKWKQRASDLLIPNAGYRLWSSSQNVNTPSKYWSSNAATQSAKQQAFTFRFQTEIISPGLQDMRSDGNSIRCFKNEWNAGLNIYNNWWTWAVIVFTGTVDNGTIVTLTNPKNWNIPFGGWYSSHTFEDDTRVNVWDKVPENLYAKRVYTYTVTIKTTPTWYGRVSSWSLTVDSWTQISIETDNTLRIGNNTITGQSYPFGWFGPAQIWQTSSELPITWYIYSFSGWINSCGNKVTSNCTITWEFKRECADHYVPSWNECIPETYTVTWSINGEETSGTVVYNGIPSHEDPESYVWIDHKVYTFTKWQREWVDVTLVDEKVTEDVTYTAVFTAWACDAEHGYHDVDGICVNTYTVTWSINGEETSGTVVYNGIPSHEDPESYVWIDHKVYIFTKWQKKWVDITLADEKVTEDVTYTAVFTPFTITITWPGECSDNQRISANSSVEWATMYVKTWLSDSTCDGWITDFASYNAEDVLSFTNDTDSWTYVCFRASSGWVNVYSGVQITNIDKLWPKDILLQIQETYTTEWDQHLSWSDTRDNGCGELSGYIYTLYSWNTCEWTQLTSWATQLTWFTYSLEDNREYCLAVYAEDIFWNTWEIATWTFNVDINSLECHMIVNPDECTNGPIDITLTWNGIYYSRTWFGETGTDLTRTISGNWIYTWFVWNDKWQTWMCHETIVKYDNIMPIITSTIFEFTGYECETITWNISANELEGDCSILSYSWNGWDYWRNITSSGIYSSITWIQSITVNVKDEAWNTTWVQLKYEWLDRQLMVDVANKTYDLWIITWNENEIQIEDMTTSEVFNVTWYGNCEIVTGTVISCTNATWVLQWRTWLKLSFAQNFEWTWSCTITFTDWDTIDTWTIIFEVDINQPTMDWTLIGWYGNICTSGDTFTVTWIFSEAVTWVELIWENVTWLTLVLWWQESTTYVWTWKLTWWTWIVWIETWVTDLKWNSLSGTIDELILGNYDNASPAKVILRSPSGIVTTTGTTLIWDEVSDNGCAGGVEYAFTITWDDNYETWWVLNGTSVVISNLKNGNTYHRNVWARDLYGNRSDSSQTREFTVNTWWIPCTIIADRESCGSWPIILTLVWSGEWLSWSWAWDTWQMIQTGVLKKTVSTVQQIAWYTQNNAWQTWYCEFKTERIWQLLDTDVPTISIAKIVAWYECQMITWSVSVQTWDSCGKDELDEFIYNWKNGEWTSSTFATTSSVATWYDVSLVVSDGAWNSTWTNVRFEWIDSPVSATGFTRDLQNWTMINWIQLSNAKDWACGYDGLTATWTCTNWSLKIDGSTLTYTRGSQFTWSDSCTLIIKDNDGWTWVQVVAKFETAYIELLTPENNKQFDSWNVVLTWTARNANTNNISWYLYQIGTTTGFTKSTWITLNLTPGNYNWLVSIVYKDGEIWWTSEYRSFKVIQIQNYIWWGGWWARLVKDYCPDGDMSDSYYDGICTVINSHMAASQCRVDESRYSDEEKWAYLYAYVKWITTQCPIYNADLDGYLYRDQFAKMIAIYAINVVWREPDFTKTWCSDFKDISSDTPELQRYMTLACQLELMWMNADWETAKTYFDPYSVVTRAEFGTVFSRLLFGDMYNVKNESEVKKQEWFWYKAHLQALKDFGVMTKIDGTRPKYLEHRGWAILMLQRADYYGIFHWKSPAKNGISALFTLVEGNAM